MARLPPVLIAGALMVAGGCRARPAPVGGGPTGDGPTGDGPASDGPTSDAAPCRLGGTTAEAPVTVACGQTAPARLTFDRTNVYWTVQAAGAVVMKAPLAGGLPQPLVYDTSPAFGITVDGSTLYFTQPAAGRVMRVPIAGGQAVALATKVDSPLHIVTDGTSLYWTGGTVTGTVSKLRLRGGATPVTLLTGLPKPRAIAVAGGFVYWTDLAEGTVMRASADDPDGGAAPAPVRIAFALRQPADLALWGDQAYVPDQAGRIMRAPLGGSGDGAAEKLADVDGVPFAVAVDGVSVYWSTLGDGGAIYKAPIAGTTRDPPRLIAGALHDPHFIAVDGTTVYWGEWTGGGAIEKAAK